jgi:hypothetical protein
MGSCNHTVCKACGRQYILTCMKSKQFPIHCPICTAEIHTSKTNHHQLPSPPHIQAITKSSRIMDTLFGKRNNTTKRPRLNPSLHFTFPSFHSKMPKQPQQPITSALPNDLLIKTPSELTAPTLRQLLTDAEFESFNTLALVSLTERDASYITCPTPSCPTIFCLDDTPSNLRHRHDHDRRRTKAACPTCSTLVCLSCRARDHTGLSCTAYRKKRESLGRTLGKDSVVFEELVLSEGWVRCPSCTIVTSKVQGCNKMVCDCCKALYCFKCGQFLDKNSPYSVSLVFQTLFFMSMGVEVFVGLALYAEV